MDKLGILLRSQPHLLNKPHDDDDDDEDDDGDNVSTACLYSEAQSCFNCHYLLLSLFCTERYVAVYTYTSDEAGDLTFSEGDVINVVRADGDWWTGNIGQRSGIFPGNFVKKCEEPQIATAAPVEEVELSGIYILSQLY